MKRTQILSEFYKLKNALIQEMYLRQYMDWLSLTTKSDSELIARIITSSVERSNDIEKSEKLLDLLNIILNNPTSFDKNIIEEAQIMQSRILNYFNESNVEICKSLLDLKRSYYEAKKYNNFKIVEPYLDDFIQLKINNENITDYNSILIKRIFDISPSKINDIFSVIKKNVNSLLQNRFNVKYAEVSFEDKKAIISYLIELINLNKDALEIYYGDESFMSSFGRNDVKISLNLSDKNLFNFISKCCHELGHALYEQTNDNAYDYSFLSGGASTSMHEAIANYYERYVGNSEIVQDYVSNHLISKCIVKNYINNPSSIRINANEFEYPVHILIRYEIEKGLFDKSLKVGEINEIWKESYKKYFGIEIKSDLDGILQDPHWFNNNYAYFPTYLLARVYASQLKHEVDRNISVDSMLKNQDLSSMNNWLIKNILRHGAAKSPKELIQEATNEDINCKYYLDSILYSK